MSPIELAAKAQHRAFTLYICVLVAGGLITAGLTVWLSRATDRYQGAVKADADARIAEASRDAAHANERATGLENANLVLRKDLNEAADKVASAQRDAANAQKDAAEAKEAQQRVETELARQQERAVKAERDLLNLRRGVAPRRLSGEQRRSLRLALSGFPNNVAIVSALMDGESSDFADDLEAAFREAHWETMRIRNRVTESYGVAVGIVGNATPEEVTRIGAALKSVGVHHVIEHFSAEDHSTSPWFQANVLYLVVNHKPSPKP